MAKRKRGGGSKASKSQLMLFNQYTSSTLQLSLISVITPLAAAGGIERIIPSINNNLPFTLVIEALTGILIKSFTKNTFRAPHSSTILWGTITAMAISTAQYLNTGNQVVIPYTGVTL